MESSENRKGKWEGRSWAKPVLEISFSTFINLDSSGPVEGNMWKHCVFHKLLYIVPCTLPIKKNWHKETVLEEVKKAGKVFISCQPL